MVFETAQKVTKHFGCFDNKISYQEIPKIAESCHTGANQLFSTVVKSIPKIYSVIRTHFEKKQMPIFES